MLVHGRRIYPQTLIERRLLTSLGTIPLRVPRGVSPYLVSRRLTRAAQEEHPDVTFTRNLLQAASQSGLASRRGGPVILETHATNQEIEVAQARGA